MLRITVSSVALGVLRISHVLRITLGVFNIKLPLRVCTTMTQPTFGMEYAVVLFLIINAAVRSPVREACCPFFGSGVVARATPEPKVLATWL